MAPSTAVTTTAPAVSRLWLAELALLSVAIIWGVNIPLMKTALALTSDGRTMHPYAFNAIRLLISAIVLVGFAVLEFRSGVRPSPGLPWSRVFVYALLVSVLYQLLFLLAVSRASSADISLIMATVPMWTALLARFFLRETLPPLAWCGLIIAFTGTMIVTLQKPVAGTAPATSAEVASADISSPSSSEPGAAAVTVEPDVTTNPSATANADRRERDRLIGNILSLVAALAWAGGTVFSRPLLRSISPTQLSACSATLGLPFHFALAWFALPASLPLLRETSMQLCLLYSGVLSTGLALAMWSYGVKTAGAAQAAIFQNLTPIVAISAAWLWRRESVSIGQTIGGIMIISGLIIMRRSRESELRRIQIGSQSQPTA